MIGCEHSIPDSGKLLWEVKLRQEVKRRHDLFLGEAVCRDCRRRLQERRTRGDYLVAYALPIDAPRTSKKYVRPAAAVSQKRR